MSSRRSGNFVMGGNFVIGIIVFAIPGDRQLRRHHQGARGRIAEGLRRVSTLDAMPGKQMAIDARPFRWPDRREGPQRTRRKALEDEKRLLRRHGRCFEIRTPATRVAGLLVVFININRRHQSSASPSSPLSFGEAARTYTLLTVGDGPG